MYSLCTADGQSNATFLFYLTPRPTQIFIFPCTFMPKVTKLLSSFLSHLPLLSLQQQLPCHIPTTTETLHYTRRPKSFVTAHSWIPSLFSSDLHFLPLKLHSFPDFCGPENSWFSISRLLSPLSVHLHLTVDPPLEPLPGPQLPLFTIAQELTHPGYLS